MSADKAGSPPCGIYVRIENLENMLDAIGWVRQMAFAINRASGYEKNMVVIELAYSLEYEEKIVDLIPIIREQGFVPIVSGTLDLRGADGILVKTEDDVIALRGRLGEDAILGLVCDDQTSIETINKCDADYYVLSGDSSLVSRWSTQTSAMLLARGKGITNNNCGALARAGAGFVDVSDYILSHEKGVMQATVNILHALDLATQVPKTLN